MSAETKSFTIKKRLIPDYYPAFHCLAGDCRYTCCQGWNITFSKKNYLDIKQAGRLADFSDVAEHGIRRLRGERASEEVYAQIALDENGYCPILSEAGFCRLQLTCGEQVLPKVCRTFPRASTYTPSGHLELSCSSGCEAVVELLYERRDGLGFVEELLPKEEQGNVTFEDYGPLMDHFHALRALCIDILQDRRAALPHRMILMGAILRELDGRVKSGRLDDLELWLTQKRLLAADPAALEAVGALPGSKPLFILNNLKTLPLIDPPMRAFRDHVVDILKTFQIDAVGEGDNTADLSGYIDAERALSDRFGDLSYFFENIMVNLVFIMKFPIVNGSDAVWKHYIELCAVYSFFKFFTVCFRPADKDDLIACLMMASRALLHNQTRTEKIGHILVQNESATLAHMAILVNG